MPSESISTANYIAVIKDLRAKRAELDRTIAMLEREAGLNAPVGADTSLAQAPTQEPAAVVRVASPPPPQTAIQSSNNGIGEACARILRENDAPLSTRQVTDLLVQSGFELSGANPINNVWSALDNRTRAKKDVRRVGRNWRFVRSEKEYEQEAHYVNGASA